MSRRRPAAIVVGIALLVACPAALFAQTPVAAASGPIGSPSKAERLLTFLGGAATGLGVHESGHVLTSLVFDAHPGIRGIKYGPLPFFVMTHDQVSRRKEFVISSAGFWMQHAGSEWILATHPHLRDEHAPFVKGVFAFNLGVSAMYSVAAFGQFGRPERDTLGMARSLGHTGAPEPVVGALILAPAALDAYRYLNPDATWAKWTSRGVKIALMGLTLAAGR
jgi:hypothetical protein